MASSTRQKERPPRSSPLLDMDEWAQLSSRRNGSSRFRYSWSQQPEWLLAGDFGYRLEAPKSPERSSGENFGDGLKAQKICDFHGSFGWMRKYSVRQSERSQQRCRCQAQKSGRFLPRRCPVVSESRPGADRRRQRVEDQNSQDSTQIRDWLAPAGLENSGRGYLYGVRLAATSSLKQCCCSPVLGPPSRDGSQVCSKSSVTSK